MTTVAEMQTQVRTDITNTLTQANKLLQDLVNVSNVAFGDPFNVDGMIPAAYDYATVPQVEFPVLNVSGSVGSVSNTPPPAFLAPSLSAFATVVVPDFLSANLDPPTSVFSFNEAAYESALLDAQKAKLLDNLTNGGYGIEADDEVALFNRARDREVENALTRVDEVGRNMAARGFPLPPGELAVHIDRAWQDMQNKASGVLPDIIL